MELGSKGSLFEYLEKVRTGLSEESLSKVQIAISIYEIASGMKYIHNNQIIHHNIKPTNILISSDGQTKIADFGVYKLFSQDEEIGIGSQKFMAPEIINEEEYDEKIDVYSFDVLVYFILNGGKMPEITATQMGIGKKAQIPNEFTQFSRQLIDSCWNFKPKDRPSFDKINEQLVNSAHELLDLTKHEIKEVKNFIENHQKIIPHC